ncbi:MAG: response regulator [Eubacteriales bacterium]|nr:response regulator [Lachnospiraceae bacterium]MDO5128006.1 response regulator [Eubacteriales bacterium]
MEEKEDILGKLNRVLNAVSGGSLYIAELDLENNSYVTLVDNMEGIGVYLSEDCSYEQLNHRIMDLITEEYRPMRFRFGEIDFLRKALTKERQIECEYQIVSGENTWRRDMMYVVEYDEDVPVKVAWLHMRVDQEKADKMRQAQALLAAHALAKSADVARNTFLNRMNEAIRIPMNTIVGATAVAHAYLTVPERVQSCLDTISRTSKEMFTIFKNAMDMLNIEAGNTQLESYPFLLIDVLTESVRLVQEGLCEKGHKITVDFSGICNQRMLGDAGRIQQMVVELLKNAIEYTKCGGQIHISATEQRKSEDVCRYTIEVLDNGIGMSEEFQKTMFEPYAREERSETEQRNATGLGLVIARNIARVMDGDILVESQYGKGTKAILTFRCMAAPENMQIASSDSDEKEKPHYANSRVLLVEDDDISAEIMQDILQAQGVLVEWARNGVEAVQMIEASEEGYYRMVFMNLLMPKMDGFEATAAIRSLERKDVCKLPIVAITASVLPEDRLHAMACGMVDYIQKPVDYGRFTQMLQHYL